MAETISRKSVIYDILYDFKKGNLSAQQAEGKLKGFEKSIGGLGSTLKAVGGVFAAAFTVTKLVEVTKEAIRLAAAAEGVQNAFAKLNRPDLLNQLRTATRNTISDLDLMKAAVKAENFKIPLDRLAGFFEFAQKRARATGESVNFLVESIVTGIGRKSSLVLDNLGISVTELQAEIKKTGDFTTAAANIIERESLKMGAAINTTADSFEKVSAATENFLVAIGGALNKGIVADFADTLGDLLVIITDLVTGQNSFNKALDESLEKAQKFTQDQSDTLLASANALTKLNEQTRLTGEVWTQAQYDAALAAEFLAIQQERVAQETESSTIAQLRNINFLNEEISRYDELIKTTGTVTKESRNQTAKYTEEINKLKREIELILTPVENLNKLNLEGVEVGKLTQKSIESQTQVRNSDKKSIEETIAALGDLAKAQENASVPETDPSKAGSGLIEKRIEQIKSYLSASQEINTSLQSLQESVTNNSAAYQADADALAQALQNKLITQEQYNQGIEQLNRDKARADLAFTLAEIAINSGLAIASIVKSATQTSVNPIQAVVEIIAGIAAVLAGISQAYSAVSAAGYEEGTPFLERGKNKQGKDTIPIMANEGEAIIPTDKNSQEPGLAKAWIDGDLDKYIYRNYVMPEMIRATGKTKSEKDYSEKFYRQYLATQEQTAKQVKILSSIDSKLKGGKEYQSRYGRA